MDYGFSFHTENYIWRIPTALQAVFLIPMLLLVWIIDESPRWLASHDRQDEALAVLHRLQHGSENDFDTQARFEDIVRAVQIEKQIGSGSWKDLLRNDDIQSQRRLLIACAIQAFQQLGGINAIIYYSGTLFQKSIGFSPHMSALMSGFLQTWFFVASFIPWFLIDRIGRRPLLLSMISVMAAVMAVQAALIYQVQNQTSVAHSAGIAAAVMLFIFQGAFTIGFQATVWVYPTEILPLRLRQKGSSISTASNWIMNYMIVQITPPAISNIGWRTYIIFAVLNATWVPIIFFFFPETKRKCLRPNTSAITDVLQEWNSKMLTGYLQSRAVSLVIISSMQRTMSSVLTTSMARLQLSVICSSCILLQFSVLDLLS